MYIEIETKLKVESLEDVKRNLIELGAGFLAEQLQTDYYFDSKDRTLTKSDKCLRLRQEVSGNSEKYFLTYKGAKEKDQFKKRQEIDIEVKDLDATEKLLVVLEYRKVLIVEKRRRIWRLKDCVVALDELPLLGDFVEIEGPEDQKIAEVLEDLGLANLPHIVESYASLMEAKLNQCEALRDTIHEIRNTKNET